MTNTDHRATRFAVVVKPYSETMRFDDKNTIAKKLFDFLVSQRDLQAEPIALCTNGGIALSSFPQPTPPDILSALREVPEAWPAEAEFVITTLAESTRQAGIQGLQADFSALLSILYHNERLRSFIFQGLDTLPNSICVYDKDTRLIYANSDFCNYIHIKDRDAAYGKPIDEVLAESGIKFTSVRAPLDYLKVKDVIKYGKPVVNWEVEVVSTKKAGESMVASNDMYPLFDAKGNVSGVVEISRSRNMQIRQIRNALGLSADYTFEDIIGNSTLMTKAKELAMSFAASPYNVLIYGESGTGKELFAQSIHNYSDRRDKPFVAINCASISSELIDSELFGYESGAFTGASKKGAIGKFELANGGTLFLDEVAELPLHAQTKLLRTLETHQITRIGGSKNISVDVRVIAATNRSLEQMITEGLFRDDLYYRLMVLNLTIPPLRERPEDIIPCCDFFLRQAMRINNFGPKTIAEDAKRLMMEYDWPGNVRELRNVINRLYLLSNSTVITKSAVLSSLKAGAFGSRTVSSLDKPPEERLDEKREAAARAQADLLKEALTIAGGNKTQAAQLLGISRKTLYNMLERHQAFFQ